MNTTMILTFLWLAPLSLGLLFLGVPASQKSVFHQVSLVFSILYLVLVGLLYPSVQGLGQLQVAYSWIPDFGVCYALKLDGLSYALIALSALLNLLVVIISPQWILQKIKSYYVYLFALLATMVGALLASDMILFYIFWEAMLLPMALLIGVFGSEKRIYAAIKFFLYTMLGGLSMLVAIIGTAYAVYGQTGVLSFAYDAFLQFPKSSGWALGFFILMTLAFFVKVPLFPLYTWLPDAHTEAPAGGSVILAGVLLKLGIYGLLRFALPIYSNIYLQTAQVWVLLAVVGIVWGGLLAWAQNDVKRLVACSSVSHMGFIVLGLFSGSLLALRGGLFQMIAHGLSTGALFFMIGMMYARTHSRKMDTYGGLAKLAPEFSFFFIFFALASAGLPGLAGFIGEFLVLLGSFALHPWLSTLAASGVLLAAIYLLNMVQRVFYGPAPEGLHFPDLSWRERVVVWPLLILIVVLGVFPQPVLNIFDRVIDQSQHYLWNSHDSSFGCKPAVEKGLA